MDLEDQAVQNERPRQQRRVLVVDDHAEMRLAVTRLLRGLGHEVMAAEDGAQALSAIETFHPDAAVVDLSLRDMSGIELAAQLRRLFPDGQLRLIALTAYEDEDVRQACLAAGFDAYVVKAGGFEELDSLLQGRSGV